MADDTESPAAPALRLATRRVLVTGGTSGLGLAMASALAAAGASVALDPAIMGPPIVWLASADADGLHDERLVATEFDGWLRHRGSEKGR